MSTLRNASRVVTIPAITKGNFEYYVQVEGFQFDYCITDAIGNVYTLNALSANKSAQINAVYTFSQSPVVPIATHSDEAINKGQMDAADEYLFDLIADVEATIPQPNDGILSLNTTGLTNTQTSFSANQDTDSTFTIHIPDALSAFSNDTGFITSNALNGYATQNWVNQQGYLTQLPTHQHTWSQIIDTPTTLSGYGISNAMSTEHVANAITASNINSWNKITNHGILEAQSINNKLVQDSTKAFLNLNLNGSIPTTPNIGDVVWNNSQLEIYTASPQWSQGGFKKLTGLQPDFVYDSVWSLPNFTNSHMTDLLGGMANNRAIMAVFPYMYLSPMSAVFGYGTHPDMVASGTLIATHNGNNDSDLNAKSYFYFDTNGEGYLGSVGGYAHFQGVSKIWSDKHFTQTNVNSWIHLANTIQNYYTKNEALNLFVGLNGVQTIYNTKTFIESPVIPVATLPNHAVNKSQLDEAITENWGSRDW